MLTTINALRFGPIGIADVNGKYTYYSTLPLATAASVAGETIEFFADVTDTSGIAVDLRPGVKINGNGHTFTFDSAGSAEALKISATYGSGEFYIFNLKVRRINGTGVGVTDSAAITSSIGTVTLVSTGTSYYSDSGHGLYFTQNNHIIKGGEFVTDSATKTGCRVNSGVVTGSVIDVRATGGVDGIGGNIQIIRSCHGFALATGSGISSGLGNVYDSYGSGVGSGISARRIYNSYGEGSDYGIESLLYVDNSTGVGVNVAGIQGSYIYNSRGECDGGPGIKASKVYNSQAISTGGAAIVAASAGIILEIHSTYLYSLIGNAFEDVTDPMIEQAIFTNCFLKVEGALDIVSVGSNFLEFYGCTFYSVIDNTIQAIDAPSAKTVKYADNKYKNVITPIGANITQGIVSTMDNQGNILT